MNRNWMHSTAAAAMITRACLTSEVGVIEERTRRSTVFVRSHRRVLETSDHSLPVADAVRLEPAARITNEVRHWIVIGNDGALHLCLPKLQESAATLDGEPPDVAARRLRCVR